MPPWDETLPSGSGHAASNTVSMNHSAGWSTVTGRSGIRICNNPPDQRTGGAWSRRGRGRERTRPAATGPHFLTVGFLNFLVKTAV